MAYEVMILCHLHMPLYFLGTFTEYPYLCSGIRKTIICHTRNRLSAKRAEYAAPA